MPARPRLPEVLRPSSKSRRRSAALSKKLRRQGAEMFSKLATDLKYHRTDFSNQRDAPELPIRAQVSSTPSILATHHPDWHAGDGSVRQIEASRTAHLTDMLKSPSEPSLVPFAEPRYMPYADLPAPWHVVFWLAAPEFATEVEQTRVSQFSFSPVTALTRCAADVPESGPWELALLESAARESLSGSGSSLLSDPRCAFLSSRSTSAPSRQQSLRPVVSTGCYAHATTFSPITTSLRF